MPRVIVADNVSRRQIRLGSGGQQSSFLSPREFATGHWQIAGSGHASPEARI
jgi:hypothetical protein